VSLPPAYRLGPALGLGVLLAFVCLPGLGRADDDDNDKKKNNNETQQSTSKNKKNTSSRPDAPDLEVTGLALLTNALGQVSDREVMFRVVNIGTEDAPATTARVEITGSVVNVTGSGSAVERPVPIPALKAGGSPFYGTAELPGLCDGHSVKISVNVKDDDATGNNSVGPTKVCPEKPMAPQSQTSGGPATTLDQARGQGTTLNLPNMGENTVDYGDPTEHGREHRGLWRCPRPHPRAPPPGYSHGRNNRCKRVTRIPATPSNGKLLPVRCFGRTLEFEGGIQPHELHRRKRLPAQLGVSNSVAIRSERAPPALWEACCWSRGPYLGRSADEGRTALRRF
jgi:hypothetical protein